MKARAWRVWLIGALVALLGRLPLAASQAAGAFLGTLFHLLPNDLRKVTRINLALCFPKMPPEERERLARRALVETGKSMAEVPTLWNTDADRILKLVAGTTGEELATADFVEGKGLIVGVPHLGAWEFLALYYAARNYPINVLYRPPRLPEAERLLTLARERLGARLIPATPQGIRSLVTALKRGEIVAILPDQEPGRGKGVFAPFFDQPAYTMVLLSRLAATSKAPVYFCYAQRLPRGAGYRLHFLPAPAEIAGEDPEEAATLVNELVERCVQAVPEQYQWGYKRFKTRPPNRSPVY